MAMPVYGGSMADEEEHGRSQTLAKIAKKHFCLEFAEGLSTPTSPDLPGQYTRKCALLAAGGSDTAPGSAPLLSSRQAWEILFCSILFIHFSFRRQLN